MRNVATLPHHTQLAIVAVTHGLGKRALTAQRAY